jgi:TetR/AcrR family transcriptional regulator, mexCD-oprJ operon repressor
MNSDPGPAARPYGRRADAERNRERVMDHAARLLCDDPAIGMVEIASASGIGRATLYRHFPSRENLIEAIIDRALAEAEKAIEDSRLEEGTAAEALLRLVAALIEIGDRYRFLVIQRTEATTEEQWRVQQDERFGAAVNALFKRGQDSGEFSLLLAPSWMATIVGGLIVTVVHEVVIGNLDKTQARAIVSHAALQGVSA